MLLLSFVIILQSLCSPNEDFRKPKNISDRRFEHFFKGVSTRFGRRLLENKVVTKDHSIPENQHIMLLVSFVSSCKVVTKDRIVAPCDVLGFLDGFSGWFFWMLLSFCNNLLKSASNFENALGNRARNPRFLMPLFGHKTGFRARMNEIKSGIPCSGLAVSPPCGKQHFMLPKRRFWKAASLRHQRFRPLFRSTFQGFEYSIWATNR